MITRYEVDMSDRLENTSIWNSRERTRVAMYWESTWDSKPISYFVPPSIRDPCYIQKFPYITYMSGSQVSPSKTKAGNNRFLLSQLALHL